MLRRLIFALAAAAALLGPHAVRAHAVLLETVPEDEARLDAAPTELRLTFNEPVRPVFLRLIDGAGRQLLAGTAVQVENATMTAAVPPLAAGAYIVSWRAVSIDAHPIGGAFVFRIGAGAADAVPVLDRSGGAEGGWRMAAGAVRFLVYGLILLAAGGALFVTLVLRGDGPPGAVRRYLLAAAAGAAVALLLSLGIEGGLLALGRWTTLLDPATWLLGAAGPTGTSVAVSLLGLALIAIGQSGRVPGGRFLAPAGALVAVAGLGFTGHAATAPPRALMAPVVVLHALAAAFWIGAFWPLAWMLRHRPKPAAIAALRRFSALALGAVGLLVLAGTVLSVVQLGSVAALWESLYGLVLLGKLGAVLGLLALAAVNRWRLTPAVARGGAPAADRLRRSIAAEMALAVAVLAATAALGTVPPPRNLAEPIHAGHHDPAGESGAGYRATLQSGAYIAHLEIAPARAGVNTIIVHVMRSDGATPVDPQEAIIAAALPEAGVEPITRRLERAGPGHFRFTGPVLSLPGRWTLRIEVLVSDFENATFEAEIPIR